MTRTKRRQARERPPEVSIGRRVRLAPSSRPRVQCPPFEAEAPRFSPSRILGSRKGFPAIGPVHRAWTDPRPAALRFKPVARAERRAGFHRSPARRSSFPGEPHTKVTQEEDAISTPGKSTEPRVNERIRIPQVRVIADDGAQLGILTTREAIALAQSKGLDLVEVAPTARPPVCKLMDYGKFKYEANRAAKAAKKKQHQMQLKEVKMRPKIEDHDYNFKLKHAREFLDQRDKVKFTVTFRGREMAHQELGFKIIEAILADLADVAVVESPPRSEGRTLSMVLSPKAAKTPVAKSSAPAGTGNGSEDAAPAAS